MVTKYVNSRDTAEKLVDDGLVDARTMLQAALLYMSCDDVTAMLHANEFLAVTDEDEEEEEEEEKENPLRALYVDCMCPDCGEDIPMDADEGGACEHCGHAWCDIPKDEDEDESIEP